MGAFSQFILDFKIYLRIHGKYKYMFPDSKIFSLLPKEVEKIILSGTVIEKGASFNSSIKFIGKYTYIGKNTAVMCCESIGAFCSISADVKIGLMSHPQNQLSSSPAFYTKRRGFVNENKYDESNGKDVIIENDVLISANVLIKNGVSIGTGAIIGAGAFVNEDVPPYAIVAGTPAKVIRYRFEQHLIEKLLASKWWEKSDDEIRKAGHFDDPEKFLEVLNAQSK